MAIGVTGGGAPGERARGGTRSSTQVSSVAVSGATPGETGKALGLAAVSRSIPVRRVSLGVQCLGLTWPSIAAATTKRDRKRVLYGESVFLHLNTWGRPK